MFFEVGDIGLAFEKPEKPMNDRPEMEFLSREAWEAIFYMSSLFSLNEDDLLWTVFFGIKDTPNTVLIYARTHI